MKTPPIRHGDWVVVCDGRKALILENQGEAQFPNLRKRETYAQDNPATSVQGADKPGRVHQSAGSARSAMEQTDWHDEAERAFLTMLAHRLDAAVAAGETDAIFLVAAPRALGMIRQAYSPALQDAIREELAKDYASKPIDEIERLMTG